MSRERVPATRRGQVLASLSLGVALLLALGVALGDARCRGAVGGGEGKLPPVGGILYNEDDSNRFTLDPPGEMKPERLDRLVDELADSQVTAMLVCCCAKKTGYPSTAWEVHCEGFDPAQGNDQPFFGDSPAADRDVLRRWAQNLRTMLDQGIDPMARMLQRCRTRGISPWVSIRMNDVHDASLKQSSLHSRFWLQNTQYWRYPDRMNSWNDRCLNYGLAPVREHMMALIREVCQRFDMDGLELDWNRFPHHFREGEERAQGEVLTRWMGEVRQVVREAERRLGHPIRLVARVPARPEVALGTGLDAVSWAKAGWIDHLVVAPFWATTDFDIPVEAWTELLQGTGVGVTAGLEVRVQPHPGAPAWNNTPERRRGAALTALSRSSQGIYLFNYFDVGREMPTLLQELGSADVLLRRDRNYVVTYTDISVPGHPLPAPLPRKLAPGEGAAFRLHVGPKPLPGSLGTVRLWNEADRLMGSGGLEVRLNGQLATNAEAATYEAEVMTAGYNTIAVTNRGATPLTVGGVELAIRVGVPRRVYTYDARPLRRLDTRQPAQAEEIWDTMHLISALQGLANRVEPRLHLFYCAEFGVDTDTFWLQWQQRKGGWLMDVPVTPLAGVDDLLRTFRSSYRGLVVYDPAVPATANLASTAAGCLDLLPVRFSKAPQSLFQRLTQQHQLPVELWLVNPDGTSKFTGQGKVPDTDLASSGSAKVDAYRWAVKRFLESGLADPRTAAYYIDAAWLKLPTHAGTDMHTLCNHDYYIARKSFFFDLSPWGDEAPNDDPGQRLGLDREMFLGVLRALYDANQGRILSIGGFPPWPFKYTDHGGVGGKHGGVPTEWEFGRLISQYNGYMEADAAGLSALANASFYAHYPLAPRYPQKAPRPDAAAWRQRGYLDAQGKVVPRLYIGHYVGDYDAPSWLYKAVPAFFRDPDRGRVPMGWAFNPNLADRVPQALEYAYRQATTNDYFIAGDSGAGYLNARALTVRPESGLPSGLEAWGAHCAAYYRRWDLTITGFVLDGSAGASTEREFEVYRRFSPDGVGVHYDAQPALRAGVPACRETDLPDAVEAAADVLARAARPGQPVFFWARSILKTPRWYVQLEEKLRERHPDCAFAVVDPYTFFGLAGRQAGLR